jgi:SAM-dependent methyltransferase
MPEQALEKGTQNDSTAGKLRWTDCDPVRIGGGEIQVARNLKDQSNHISGLRKDATAPLRRRLFLAAMRWHNYLLVDGFIEREVAKLIRRHWSSDRVFLEVGCGDMSLHRFIPSSTWYNAFDLSLSEANIRQLFAARSKANIALASAKSIPLETGSVDFFLSTECLEHIPGVEAAVAEMRRVARKGAKAIITIPNNYGRKYKVKGPHPEHVNDWTFEAFTAFMAERGFRRLEGYMKGRWIGFPTWLTRTSYQLPLSSRAEFENTNFFYVFEAV